MAVKPEKMTELKGYPNLAFLTTRSKAYKHSGSGDVRVTLNTWMSPRQAKEQDSLEETASGLARTDTTVTDNKKGNRKKEKAKNKENLKKKGVTCAIIEYSSAKLLNQSAEEKACLIILMDQKRLMVIGPRRLGITYPLTGRLLDCSA
eukprot:GHVS01035666.1.p1 GENE.GHVS01035666.1~~GHVS01035666.1.p1  ORF type:complete len:148 (-),score=14.41 GHVS01035666.1:17-460(-)